jgi:hypothetical protein
VSTAPERIVVAYYDDAEQSIRWEDGPEWIGETEYVRADLFAALEAERDRLRTMVFKHHEIVHTYYGGCHCEDCEAHRVALEEGGDDA